MTKGEFLAGLKVCFAKLKTIVDDVENLIEEFEEEE